MEEFIKTFHIDWRMMLAQVLNFGLVFLALYVLAAKPLRELIAKRGKEIAEGLDNAKLSSELKSNTEREYQSALLQARSEANAIFENAKKESILRKTEMLEQAKNEVTVMIENGKKTLEIEKVKMMNDVKKEIVDLVIQTTEKLIATKVDGSYNEKVVKELNNL